jgi:hypothetical protein
MAHGKAVSIVGVLALAGFTTLGSPAAEAHGRGGGRRLVVRGGYGYAPFAYGWGFSPFFDPYWAWAAGPYYHQPAGGVDMNVAMMTGWGAVELNVKPNRADVWVDGKYVGEARDLDGYPSYLWLEKGAHHVAVYKAGYRTFEEDIDVGRGMKRELKLRLEPGDSQPPGTKPADGGKGAGRSGDKPRDAAPGHGEVD